jgi:GNAT superfamily N-acetyltransferase
MLHEQGRKAGRAPSPRIRIASTLELPGVNAIIDQAMATWDTTERVKRLAGPVYRYSPADLDNMWVMVAENGDEALAGMAALEEADENDQPVPGRGLLLHGIFVAPGAMGQGVGRALVGASTGIAREMGYRGLLVKAVRQSRGFFERCGLTACDRVDNSDYPYRYWREFEDVSRTAAAANAA